MQSWLSTRRELIKGSMGSGLGLLFGFSLPWVLSDDSQAEAKVGVLNSFVHLFADNRVQITVVKAEMGQGVSTSMAMLIAEEMDADWSLVEVILEGEQAPYADPKAGFSGTFGSTSVRAQYERLRTVGAAIRDILLEAAASQLQRPIQELQTSQSWIVDQKGQKLLSFGSLLQKALDVPVPQQPKLKSPDQFQLIGKSPARKDTAAKIAGEAIYGLDVRLPGLAYAAVRHHKVFGSTLLNFAELKATVPQGFTLLELPQAILAIGPSYWQAQRILDKLPARYSTTSAMDSNSQASIEQSLSAAVQDFEKTSVVKKGDGSGALALCDSILEAEYFTPFLAHGAMEPLNCTAWVQGDRCEFWVPTQSAQLVSLSVAGALGKNPKDVKVHVTWLGGGFGRKVETDFVVQAALASQAIQGPVQLIWSRTEDTQHDFYRPAFSAKLKAGLDQGQLRVWVGKNAGPSISRRQNPNTKIDFTSIDGFTDIPYAIEHQEMFHQEVDVKIPVGFWRSVGKSQNSFFVESFLDEAAQKLAKDPFQLRKNLLLDQPRALAVLDRLAEVCSWATHSKRQAMGLAFSEGFGSLAAMVAQVALVKGKVKVERIWTVVDCGQVVNREGAEAQVQGAAIYGLAAALLGKVTVTAGKVDQSIFADRPFIKLADAPLHEVHFINSGAAIGGLGEVATPLVAPAVANALFSLTGKRARRLPLNDFSWT